MLQSPVSPESYDGRDVPRAFPRIHNYEAGLEVAPHQNREKSDLDPIVVLDSPADTNSPVYVNHGRWQEAPQVIDTTAPQAMGDAALEPNGAARSGAPAAAPAGQDRDGSIVEKGSTLVSERDKPKRWWGLGGRVLLLILVLVLLLVGAIIGGAVGGTQAKKHKSTLEESHNGTSTASSQPVAATGAAHVHFQLQTYEAFNYGGRFQLFDEPGVWRPAFPILSYVWRPTKDGDLVDTTPLLRCSVSFCANETLNGWWGASDKKQPGGETLKHDANFLHIGCEPNWVRPECTSLGLDKPAASTTVSTVPVWEAPGSPTSTDSEVPEETGSSTTTTSGSASARSTQRPSSSSRSSSGSGSSSSSSSGSGSGSSSVPSATSKSSAA